VFSVNLVVVQLYESPVPHVIFGAGTNSDGRGIEDMTYEVLGLFTPVKAF
jgi:hypothetical protein